ncbi:hypothetical protein EMPG_12789 [Blastomyces silverae]|uniref:Pathway-specific nitrogen regulator n=1 Tax=Blastomyces silverae TaxID=2060906 RepID=A0A0H1BSG7_9EURO|nr:hypothetical protein EMPG_12789 [Blastomyces silverae]
MADLAPEPAASDASDAGTRDSNEIARSPSSAVNTEGESQLLEEKDPAAVVEADTSLSDHPAETEGVTEPHAYDHGHHERSHSSASSSQPSATFTGDEDYFDEDGRHAARSTSSRSSISSLPGSVVVYPSGKHHSHGTITPSNFRGHYMQHYSEGNSDHHPPVNSNGSKRSNYPSRLSKIAPGVRDRDSPFRHPSSVRAMQMGDEEEYNGYGYGYDHDDLTPSRSRKHRAGGSRHSCQSVSGMSMHSLVSTPPSAKRNYKSPQAKEEPVQKEYPLVLLHCTLLPPSLSLPQGLGTPSAQLLQEVLPEKYWARWKLLEDKIVNSGVLRYRGLLISHPQEMYDLLEERLLESLELVRPRLGYGHFLGREDVDCADDADGTSGAKEDCGDSSDGCEGEECADCGARVLRHLEGEKRKWEIKVYAANGLMRAGAWAAAWREMEKVDVEVGLALPVEIKRELERRITEEDKMKLEEARRLSEEEKRRREIYGEPPPPTQDAIDGLEDDDMVPPFQSDFDRSSPPPSFEQPEPPPTAPSASTFEHGRVNGHTKSSEIDLQTLCANYIRVLASDRRNVALAFLSVLVLYLSISMARQESALVHPTTSPRHFVQPNVSTPIAMEHSPPSIVISPPAASIEPEFQLNSAVDDRVIHPTSACRSLNFETPSVDETQLQQTHASQPTPNCSAHRCQSEPRSIESSVQPQLQPPVASEPTIADQPNDPSPSQHHDAICSLVQTVPPHPTQPTKNRDPTSSDQIIEPAQESLAAECQPSAPASTSTGVENPSVETVKPSPQAMMQDRAEELKWQQTQSADPAPLPECVRMPAEA